MSPEASTDLPQNINKGDVFIQAPIFDDRDPFAMPRDDMGYDDQEAYRREMGDPLGDDDVEPTLDSFFDEN